MTAHNQYGCYSSLGERNEAARTALHFADVGRLLSISKPKPLDHAIDAAMWRLSAAKSQTLTDKQKRGMLLQANAEIVLAVRAIDRGDS